MSWIPDEIGYAGLEHLDADYVAGYDAKAQVDPTEDIEILTAHGLGPGTTIVDLGAGTGVFTAAAAATGADVIAVDVSPAMVRHLRGRFADRRNVTVVRGGLPHLRTHRPAGRSSSTAATRCTNCPTSGRASRSSASPATSHRAPSSGSATWCSTSDRPTPTSSSPPGWRAASTTRRGAGRPTNSPSTCGSSSAPTAGCSSRCSNGSASRSSTSTTCGGPTAPTPAGTLDPT